MVVVIHGLGGRHLARGHGRHPLRAAASRLTARTVRIGGDGNRKDPRGECSDRDAGGEGACESEVGQGRLLAWYGGVIVRRAVRV